MKKIEVLGLQTIPEIKQGDNLARLIVTAGDKEIGGLQEKDILVLTSKIVSKAAGRLRKFDEVVPGKKALALSKRTGKDAKWLQMIFDEGHKILAIIPLKGVIERHVLRTCDDTEAAKELMDHERAICITKGKDGRIYTCDAGIDGSNHPAGIVSLLPEDPDRQAKEIRQQVWKLTGRQIAVILADTEMMPFGTMDFALGSSGIAPISRMFGQKDLYGRAKFGGMDLTAHELTAVSALVFGQTGAGIPVAVIRGYEYEINETANIANTMLPQASGAETASVLKATLRASARAQGLKVRLLLRVASWFV
jgi:coenzyme F420-0:L-glutamate ligase / coenzyme F420-1:gamma-L-glutamate ligase